MTAPDSSLWQLPTGVGVSSKAWQLECGSTMKGLKCAAAACDNGSGILTATCGMNGQWSSGTASCSPRTCENAAAPAFVTNGGATYKPATWAAICANTVVGQQCVTSLACSSNQQLSARCEYVPVGGSLVATWTQPTGSCEAPPVQCMYALTTVPLQGNAVFSPQLWIAQCEGTQENATCTVVDTACLFGGTISAKCTKDARGLGVWTDTAGFCKAEPPVQCKSAPARESVTTFGGSQFYPEPWIAKCTNTTENATCTVVDAACSSGGTISAKCVKGATGAGVWADIQGACQAPPCEHLFSYSWSHSCVCKTPAVCSSSSAGRIVATVSVCGFS